ncbi:putative LNK family protein [Dioscorea sansibarensis]
MDWYFREQSGDFVVPNDQETSEVPCTDEISPSSDDWYQVDNNKSGSRGSPEKFCGRSPMTNVGEFDFDPQNIYDQVNNVPAVYNGKGSSNSSACRESSLLNHSAGTSEASYQGQPDFQLQSNMEQMDEIFLNSLLEDDLQNLGSPYEPLPMFPASAYRSLSFENFLTDVIVEPACLVKECSFPGSALEIRDSGNKENTSSWSLIRDESKASEDSYAEPVIKSENDAITVNEAKCLEETVLHKLEGVVTQLSEKTRICFRDALYRLAESSKKAEHRNRPSAAEVDHENSRNLKKGAESKTNAIDRTVANLLFTKPSMSPALPCERPVCINNENTSVTGMQYSLDQSSGYPQATYYEDMDDE